MLLVDPFRPAPRKVVFQRLWFSDSTKRIVLRLLNQTQDTKRFLAILLDPPSQVF